MATTPVGHIGHSKPPFLSRYNSLDLLQTTAALSALPENHGKAIRLELLTGEILASFNPSRPAVPLAELHQFLAADYADHHLEDLPVNLFTDLVSFDGGDYLIFPGITEAGSFTIANLLATIFHWPQSQLSVLFKENCRLAARYVLSLSHVLARRLGYTRYQLGEVTEEALFVPSAPVLDQMKVRTVVTQAQLQRVIPGGPIPHWVTEAFTFTIAEFQAHSADEDTYLLRKPLLKLGEDCLIASPLTMSYALTDYIWQQAEQWGCGSQLREAYRSMLWNNVQATVERMGFYREEVPAAWLPVGSHLKAGVYRFDADKIALVQLVGNFSPGDQRGEDTRNLIAALQAQPRYAGSQVLDLQVASREAGDAYLMMPVGSEDVRSVIMPVEELEALLALDDTEAIDLWKFAGAKHDLFARTRQPMLMTSFLDEFRVYRENAESFHVSDDARGHLFIPPGYGADLLAKAKLAVDAHTVPLTVGNQHILFPVRRLDKHSLIYYNINDREEGQMRLLVKGFSQPIWVSPANMPAQSGEEPQSWFRQLTEAVAYWLWQVQPGLAPYLRYTDLPVVYVVFECHPLERFAEVTRDYTRVPDLGSFFQTSATVTEVRLLIPAEILPYLYGADNEGERELVRQLLTAFNQLLAATGHPVLSEVTQREILETHVPLGMKKKVYLLDSLDNLLIDPQGLGGKRLLQEYDVSRLLDELGPGLEALNLRPPVGDIEDMAEKRKLARNVVMKVLLPKLSRAMSRFDQRDLLIRLLALNERLIYNREKLSITTPSRIACFVSESQAVEDLKNNLEVADNTTIAVRCLIEHLSAEQTTQGLHASTTDLDELIALMSQIMMWGSICDQLTFNLFDMPMGVLPTGRIGTGKEHMREVLESYRTMKAKEDVSDAIKGYAYVFAQQNPREGGETPAFLNRAFLADFGISFSRLCEFINALIELTLQTGGSLAAVPKVELPAQLLESGHEFEPEEVEAAVTYLSLEKRARVEVPPPGYENFDISPWRFSRRLSLLRKPIVAFHNPADAANPTLHWGFRQLLRSRITLGDQVLANRLRVTEDGEMIKALGRIAKEQGEPLVRKMAARLAGVDRIIDTDVYIKPGGKLPHHTDLGDVDVLVLDFNRKILLSVECKNMAPSRNIKEMVEEVEKLLGSGSELGWMQKHVRRHDWLTQNLAVVETAYSKDLTGFTVQSFVVTTAGMLTPYLRQQELPLPLLSAYEVERHSLEALLNPEPLERSPEAEAKPKWEVVHFPPDSQS